MPNTLTSHCKSLSLLSNTFYIEFQRKTWEDASYKPTGSSETCLHISTRPPTKFLESRCERRSEPHFSRISVFNEFVDIFTRRRWSAGLDHLFEKLQARTSNGFVLGYGKIGELIVVANMAGKRIPMLVGQPLVLAHVCVASSNKSCFKLLGWESWITHFCTRNLTELEKARVSSCFAVGLDHWQWDFFKKSSPWFPTTRRFGWRVTLVTSPFRFVVDIVRLSVVDWSSLPCLLSQLIFVANEI